MSSTEMLEIVAPEKAESTLVISKLESLNGEPAIASHPQENQMRILVIGAAILGATMLGAMGTTLLIWVFVR